MSALLTLLLVNETNLSQSILMNLYRLSTAEPNNGANGPFARVQCEHSGLVTCNLSQTILQYLFRLTTTLLRLDLPNIFSSKRVTSFLTSTGKTRRLLLLAPRL